MERLTKKFIDGSVAYNGSSGLIIPAELIPCDVRTVLYRLCEYEDTGLTPEEIIEMKETANIKRCQRKGIVGVPKNSNRTIIQRISFVNEAVKYIAEQSAFELNQDKLTVNTSKIPENIFFICTARNKYIERIIQACE